MAQVSACAERRAERGVAMEIRDTEQIRAEEQGGCVKDRTTKLAGKKKKKKKRKKKKKDEEKQVQ